MRHSRAQSLAHIQWEIQSTDAAQLEKMKKKTSKYSTVDGWGWISLPQPRNQRNHFPRCPPEMGTTWLGLTGNFPMRCRMWCHHWSQSVCHLLWKCSNSILITDKAQTANKTQGSQFRKKSCTLQAGKYGMCTRRWHRGMHGCTLF